MSVKDLLALTQCELGDECIIIADGVTVTSEYHKSVVGCLRKFIRKPTSVILVASVSISFKAEECKGWGAFSTCSWSLEEYNSALANVTLSKVTLRSLCLLMVTSI